LGVKKLRATFRGMVAPELLTADDLSRLNIQDKRTELVRGRLVVREPAGFRHGVVALEIARRLSDFVTSRSLGVVVAAETGFTLFRDPDTVRAPDAAFVRADRVPQPLPRGYAAFAPDFVVEVLSPDDRAGEVLAKISDWLGAGVRLVWVLDPERRVARVYRSDGSEAMIAAENTLDGEDVLPGFTCRLSDLLP
jgi:Uma2 family endonuclease